MSSDLSEIISSCLDIRDSHDEAEFLNEFVNALQQNSDSELGFDDLDLTEKDFFKEIVQANPAPNCSLQNLCETAHNAKVAWKVVEELDWFAFYIFHRRFGWPDLVEEAGLLQVCGPVAVNRMRWSTKEEEMKHKINIVNSLDVIILWLRHQPVSTTAVHMYASALRLDKNSPVMRLQIAIHALDWLKEKLEMEPDQEVYQAMLTLLIVLITDVWSSVRSAVVNRLGPLIEKFSSSQLQTFMDNLFKLCDGTTQLWQVTDGVIHAIHAVIKRFHKEVNNHLHSHSQTPLRLGTQLFDRLPTYIAHRVKVLVFQLVSNKQLTIREMAVKTLIATLERGNEREFETCFHEVYHRLEEKSLAIHLPNAFTLSRRSSLTPLPSFEFMNPYTAESLLNMCLLLLKRIPDQLSFLENWTVIYHNTFDSYLMHPASSVRLAASDLYKFVVTKSMDNPKLVKSVLYCLIKDWMPKQDRLLKRIVDIASDANCSSFGPQRASVTDADVLARRVSENWEWREGRLLVEELVCKELLKNHFVYSFYPSTLSTTGLISRGGVMLGNAMDSLWSSGDSKQNADLGAVAQSCLQYQLLSPLVSMPDLNYMQNVDKSSEGSIGLQVLEPDSKAQSYAGKSLKQRSFSEHISSKSSKDFLWNSVPLSMNHTISISFGQHQDRTDDSLPLGLISAEMLQKNFDSPTKPALAQLPNGEGSVASFLIQVHQTETAESEMNDKERVKGNTSPNDAFVNMPNFRSVICQLFHTCSETLADSQWELRRIAKQTFPFVGETLRWFDPALLCDLISTHLVCEPTLMTYACLILLRDTLLHVVRLRPLLQNHLQHFRLDAACQSADSLQMHVHCNLSPWLRSCQHYLQRQCLDCVMPLAIHAMLFTALNYSDELKLHSDVSLAQIWESVVNVFLRLNSYVISKDADVQVIGYELYPSITSVNSVGGHNDPLEYILHLIEELHATLSQVVSVGELTFVLPLLPTFLGWLPRLQRVRGSDSSQTSRTLLQCCLTLMNRTESTIQLDSNFSVKTLAEVNQALKQLSDCLSMTDDTNSWWLSPILDRLFVLLERYQPDQMSRMPHLLLAVAQRIKSFDAVKTNVPALPPLKITASPSRQQQNQQMNHLRLMSSQAQTDLCFESDESLKDSDEDEPVITPLSETLNSPQQSRGSDVRRPLSSASSQQQRNANKALRRRQQSATSTEEAKSPVDFQQRSSDTLAPHRRADSPTQQNAFANSDDEYRPVDDEEASDWDSSDSEELFDKVGRTEVENVLIAFVNNLATRQQGLYDHTLKKMKEEDISILRNVLSMHI